MNFYSYSFFLFIFFALLNSAHSQSSPFEVIELTLPQEKEALLVGIKYGKNKIIYNEEGILRFRCILNRWLEKRKPSTNNILTFYAELSEQAGVSKNIARGLGIEKLIPENLKHLDLGLNSLLGTGLADNPSHIRDKYQFERNFNSSSPEAFIFGHTLPLSFQDSALDWQYKRAYTLSPEAFKEVMSEYEKLYYGPLFTHLRIEDTQDSFDSIAGETAIYSAKALEVILNLLLFKGTLGGLKAVGLGSRTSFVVASGTTFSSDLYANQLMQELSQLSSQDHQRKREVNALISHNLSNYWQQLLSLENFFQKDTWPAFKEFLKEEDVLDLLLEQNNFYDLKYFSRFNDLPQQELELPDLLKKLKVKDKETEEIIKTGMHSPLFKELALLSIGKVKSIESKKLKWTEMGIHKITKRIVISNSIFSSEEEKAATLAHEFWHAVSKHDIYANLLKYETKEDFFWAVAAEETLAELVSARVADELHFNGNSATCLRGIGDNLNIFIEYSKRAKYFGAKSLRQDLLSLVSKTHAQFYDEWKK